MKRRSLAAIAFCGILGACFWEDKEPLTLTGNAESDEAAFVERYSTKALKAAENLEVSNFYMAMKVDEVNIPSSVSTCANRDKLLNTLKSVSGISGNKALAVVVSIKKQNNSIVSEYPIYITGVNDDPDEDEDGCYSLYYRGNITPYFRHDANLDFEVKYAVKYADNVNVQTAGRILDTAKVISGVSGSGGFAVSALATMLLEPATSIIDKASSKAFSVAPSSDVGTEIISMEGDIEAPAKDGLKIDLGRAVPSLQGNASVSVALTYRSSLIGFQRSTGIAYSNSPTTLLSSVTDANIEQNLLQVVESGSKFKALPSAISLWDSADEKGQVEDFCRRVRSYLGGELQLTPDDALVARWAIMKRYSRYDQSSVIRTEDCFTTPNSGNPIENDVKRLISLNTAFIFSKTIDELSELITQKVRTLAVALNGNNVQFNQYFDVEKFTLAAPELNLLPASFQSKINSTGEPAVKLLAELFTQGFCAARQTTGNGTLLRLAVILRVDPKYNDQHPQYM